MKKCEVSIINFESDDRLLMAEMKTPTTKIARQQRLKVKKKEPRTDPKDLDNAEIKRKYLQVVTNELSKEMVKEQTKLDQTLLNAWRKQQKNLSRYQRNHAQPMRYGRMTL